ncbi:MAG: hypothetical protein ACRCY4_09140, partial [Brevinema sp.]
MLQPQKMDLTKTKMFSVQSRHNLVRFDNMLTLSDAKNIHLDIPELHILADKIAEARKNNRPVVWFCGAHVVKNGLSRFLIHFMKQKWVTHMAFNGAGSIHDFELAYLGGTSEDVPTAIEDGSFGMWEETGSQMNAAINAGASKNWGYGQSLAQYIHSNPEKFPHRDECIVYQAYLNNVPATYHITMGTDIIHQHPTANFGALGLTSGEDFKIFCNSLKDLEGGVFMNMGSSVTGPEVFLKALSIVRNQHHKTEKITTANFDIIPLGTYKGGIEKSHPHYYYRPRKNVINRPTSMGGTGLYVQAYHEESVPMLYNLLTERLGG